MQFETITSLDFKTIIKDISHQQKQFLKNLLNVQHLINENDNENDESDFEYDEEEKDQLELLDSNKIESSIQSEEINSTTNIVKTGESSKKVTSQTDIQTSPNSNLNHETMIKKYLKLQKLRTNHLLQIKQLNNSIESLNDLQNYLES
ncbi:hypothetical protein KGF54_004206 [Candida jiufengensis]|uniref:uncharacterized protein n=1 Tax=Candida jiufengensis TaxID=497108 RepID=UPI00222502B0|nr:uncharacterized protein KGF54_004206 [Candida jiufengensis]KAI5951132.1 hypothetical protein KGF54_004206 [Candida jiufengensis]